VLAVGRIFGAVVEIFGCGESNFVASFKGYDVDVVIAFAVGAVGQEFVVGTDAVQITGAYGGYQPRRSALEG
jgi:hypothetical protein